MKKNEISVSDTKDIELEKTVAKKKMGKFEKILWSTIAFFAIIWIVLQAMSYFNGKKMTEEHNNDATLISTNNFETIIEDSDFLKNNLSDSQAVQFLKETLSEKNENISQVIDEQVDDAFSPVYDNIDTFLDFHYSVVGDYSELIASATGEIATEIKDKLFGSNFQTYLDQSQDNINNEYIKNLKEYLGEVDEKAIKGVDKDLNLDILTHLSNDISQRFTVQYVKMGVVSGGAMSLKVINIVSAKVAAKAGSKLAVKVATKTALKSTAAGTAAAAGAACGPFVWICSPIAATAAWFGTDAIVVSGDEYFNRDDFKNEIVSLLDSQKEALSVKLKNTYSEKLVHDSVVIQNKYENTPIKRKTIREKLSLNNI